MDNLRLSIAIMAYGGQITSKHAMMWLELGSLLTQSRERFTLINFDHWDVNPVDKARNLALQTAFQLKSDWLFMIDADTFVEGYDDEDAGFQILRMISDADRAGAALVAAPVMRRAVSMADSNFSMVYKLDPDNKHADAAGLAPVPIHDEGRRLVPIDSAATACFAVNLAEAAKAQAVFRFTYGSQTSDGVRPGLSEDHEFCRQLREAGGKIFADPRVKTGHISKPVPIYSKPNTSTGN